MFRLWVKIIKENHLLKDTVVENASDETRTKKIFGAIEEACNKFDLGQPVWLESTIRDFKRHSKARFTNDNFMEPIDFDYMEIQILEEDF